MPLARVTRADLRGMCLDDLFVLLQWVVSELTERLTVRHEGDFVQIVELPDLQGLRRHRRLNRRAIHDVISVTTDMSTTGNACHILLIFCVDNAVLLQMQLCL